MQTLERGLEQATSASKSGLWVFSRGPGVKRLQLRMAQVLVQEQ